MDYNPADNGETGTTRSICPVGWHIPTEKEWEAMINYIGGEESGGKLKSKETWLEPNVGATNETGFSALETGGLGDLNWGTENPPLPGYGYKGVLGDMWSSSKAGDFAWLYDLCNYNGAITG